MKMFKLAMGLALVLMATNLWAAEPVAKPAAASWDGNYTFVARWKEGKADMAGWTGTMEIKGSALSRKYASADGKETKFYSSTLKQEAAVVVLTITDSHKVENKGQIHRNKFTVKGDELTMESEDGKFKEVWKKK